MELPLLLVCIQFIPVHCVDVEYSEKLVSGHRDDLFGATLATSHKKLLIGAPYDGRDHHGSVLVDVEFRITPPNDVYWLGEHLDVNQQYIVASCLIPNSVHVYQSDFPFNHKAKFHMVGRVLDVAINDYNNIFVGTGNKDDGDCNLYVYQYDGNSTWHQWQKIQLYDCLYTDETFMQFAVSGDTIIVGHSLPYLKWTGHVVVYKEDAGQWKRKQIIQPSQQHVRLFGQSIALDEDHLAVGSWFNLGYAAFTYRLDETVGKWTNNGQLYTPSSAPWACALSIHKGILVVTVNDGTHPEVCSVVYKLSKTTNINNRTVVTDSVFDEVGRLIAKEDPMTSEDQYQSAVSVHNNLVFVGRSNRYHGGVGKVFIYDISRIKS